MIEDYDEQDDPPCDICGKTPNLCDCPTCPVCAEQGNPCCWIIPHMVQAREVTSMRMAGGNEQYLGQVIMNNRLRQWAAIGWIDEGPVEVDGPVWRNTPHVVDGVIFEFKP